MVGDRLLIRGIGHMRLYVELLYYSGVPYTSMSIGNPEVA